MDANILIGIIYAGIRVLVLAALVFYAVAEIRRERRR